MRSGMCPCARHSGRSGGQGKTAKPFGFKVLAEKSGIEPPVCPSERRPVSDPDASALPHGSVTYSRKTDSERAFFVFPKETSGSPRNELPESGS